ncbi:Serine protease [Ceratobasidium sp. AG-Ba]|nr:Serine protease [Ceratobasidium sp. AG-Ba]QRW12273.1 Serine protease [Ceratobasidium sp. AG-Ba]
MSSDLRVTHSYNALDGYAAHMTDARAAELASSPDVAMVVPDGECQGGSTQADAPWGISRISRKDKLPKGSSASSLDYTFDYRTPNVPASVDVYVIDTGVNVAHVDFGGRARWGVTYGGYKNRDTHGHGTHVAGIIAGQRYGVAKNASIIAVRVLDDNNHGQWSDTIAGVNWSVQQASKSGRPSILSISIYGGASQAVDYAVTKAVSLGVHVVVCAGNDKRDAYNTSPARAPAVITVGATDISDSRWGWNKSSAKGSNFGSVVDIFAPGADVPSTWIGSNTATRRLSGTSMATPHVSGLIAHLLAVEGPRTPVYMRTRIKQLAVRGALIHIPANTK